MMNIYENGYQCGRGGYGSNPYDARRERQKYNAWQDGFIKGKEERGPRYPANWTLAQIWEANELEKSGK